MREFQERRAWRKLMFSRASFVILVGILVFMVYSTVKVYLRSRDAKEANRLVENERNDLNSKKSELEASVKRLQSEAGAEEEIRSKFPVQKPGEKTVVIVEEEAKNSLSENDFSSGFFEKVWGFIKNIF